MSTNDQEKSVSSGGNTPRLKGGAGVWYRRFENFCIGIIAVAQLRAVRQVNSGFIVAIGQYTTASQASEAYRTMQRTTLRAERYAAKTLKIFRTAEGVFYLSYSAPTTQDYATRLYKLLLVNDPTITPQVVGLGP